MVLMDPLTSLGTAAASVQLVGAAARALLGAVSVVRNLRDAPAHTALLLSDVNRSTSHILSISNAQLFYRLAHASLTPSQ